MKVLCIFVSLVVVIAKIKAARVNITDEVPEMESRSVDGEIAPEGAYPYVVGLIIERPTEEIKILICGSSLVTATRLLTAAHCMHNANSIEAVFGSTLLQSGGTHIKTNVFVVHPQFQFQIQDYDIAVVVLPQPVQFTDLIQPISLVSTQEDAVVGEWAVTAGWGVSGPNQVVEADAPLRQLPVQVFSDDVCQKLFGPTFVAGNNICASGGICGGDSGGPLVIERNNRKIVVGVASYSAEGCIKNIPSGFARVAAFLQFIQQNL